jgi:hypothetical protein
LLSYNTLDGRLSRTEGGDTQTLTWRVISVAYVDAGAPKARFFLSPNTSTQTNE